MCNCYAMVSKRIHIYLDLGSASGLITLTATNIDIEFVRFTKKSSPRNSPMLEASHKCTFIKNEQQTDLKLPKIT